MKPQIGIRFVMTDNHCFQTVMDEEAARQIIAGWINRQLPVVFGDAAGIMAWALKTDAIKVIHTFDPAAVQPQQQSQMPSWFPGKSGVN